MSSLIPIGITIAVIGIVVFVIYEFGVKSERKANELQAHKTKDKINKKISERDKKYIDEVERRRAIVDKWVRRKEERRNRKTPE